MHISREDLPPLEKRKSVRFNDEVEFHSYLEKAPSIDNLLDLLDSAGNVKIHEHKATAPPPARSYSFVPVNFARPATVPDNIQLGSDLALGSIAYKGSYVSGTVLVRNLAFEKAVFVRYSTDGWATFKELSGVYYKTLGCIDLFRFLLKVDLPPGEASLQFAVRAMIGQKEAWDSNGGRNYVMKVTVIATNNQ